MTIQEVEPVTESLYFEQLEACWRRVWPHPSLPERPVKPFGDLPICHYVTEYARRRPERDCLIYYGRRLSYREVDELSNRFANFLLDMGLKKGDRVALMLPNCPQFYIGYLGTLKAGGVCVLLNPLLKELDLESLVQEAQPVAVLTLDQLYPLVSGVVARVNPSARVIPTSFAEFLPPEPEIPLHPTMQGAAPLGETSAYLSSLLEKSSAAPPPVQISPEDYATMNFTGGTTGLPKAVLHRHRNIIYTAACIYTYNYAHLLVEDHSGRPVDFQGFLDAIYRDEVAMAAMPIFWIAGKDVGVDGPLFGGSTIVPITRWDPAVAMEAIDRYRVTTMYAPFDLYWEILTHPAQDRYSLKSLRLCVGSSFIKGLSRELRERWRLRTGAILREAAYGLTETHTCDTMTGGFHRGDLDIERSQTYGGAFCGIPQPGTLVKIVDPESGELLGPGQKGEIVIKSPSVVEGYLNKPEETAKSFREGWLHTGDIGMYDEDGFLYYISRTKYMLKVSGVSVYPTQIEMLLLKHPAIELVGVIGADDPVKGQVPIAYVKLKEGFPAVTEAELIDWCRKNMAAYNVPQRIIIESSLPLSATGKVIREELVRDYARRFAAGCSPSEEKRGGQFRSYRNLSLEWRGSVLYITINRPGALNALNRETLEEIIAVLRTEAREARVIVFTGAGNKAFVGGSDIREMDGMDALKFREYMRVFAEAIGLIRSIEKPTIAAVNGVAFGGGNALALSCDFVVAAEGAQFGQQEINVGIFGGASLLTALVGRIRAADVVFTGRALDAREAHAWGLVTRVVPADALAEEVARLAEHLASRPPKALALAKQAINYAMAVPPDAAATYERELISLCFDTRDQKEGMRAFLERRKPVFTGE